MKIRFVIFTVFLLVSCYVSAQDTESAKPSRVVKYYNHFQSGALFGEKGTGATVSFNTAHGVKINAFRAAIGVGYDDYNRHNPHSGYNVNWRSVPVFTSLAMDFYKVRSNAFYFEANTGFSRITLKKINDYSPYDKVKGGFMVSPVIGYRIHTHKHHIQLAMGYKWQLNRYHGSTFPWIWGWPGGNSYVKETMERLVVNIGIGFN